MTIRVKHAALIAALPLLAAGTALAATPGAAVPQMTISQARATARAIVPGQAANPVLGKVNGRLSYVFNIAANGQDHVVGIDAITGKLTENQTQKKT